MFVASGISLLRITPTQDWAESSVTNDNPWGEDSISPDDLTSFNTSLTVLYDNINYNSRYQRVNIKGDLAAIAHGVSKGYYFGRYH